MYYLDCNIQKCNIFENSTTKEWEQSCVEERKLHHMVMQIHRARRETEFFFLRVCLTNFINTYFREIRHQLQGEKPVKKHKHKHMEVKQYSSK